MPTEGPKSSKSWDAHVFVYWHVHLSVRCFLSFFLQHVYMYARVNCSAIVFQLDNPAASIHVAQGSAFKRQVLHQADHSASTMLGWAAGRARHTQSSIHWQFTLNLRILANHHSEAGEDWAGGDPERCSKQRWVVVLMNTLQHFWVRHQPELLLFSLNV